MDTEAMLVAARASRQSAFIRALNDEVARYAPSDIHAAALREQLREEERRLARIVQNVEAGS